jgi:hypothetical protein
MKSLNKKSLSLLSSLVAGIVLSQNAHAGSATWKLSPVSGDWNTAENWMPATVPNSPDDVANLDASNQTDVSVSSDFVQVSGIVYQPGASAYTITGNFVISGNGITNDSAFQQHLINEGMNDGGITFSGDATAGSRIVITTIGNGSVGCIDTANGGSATFINQGAAKGATESGTTVFLGHSSAGNSAIVNRPPQGNGGTIGGRTDFAEFATAGNSTITSIGGCNNCLLCS